ncbi:hypothetical protein D3C78_1088760 [compost metagenome]
MNRKAWLVLMVAVAASQSYGMPPDKGRECRVVDIELKATPLNADEIGRASLVAEGKRTGVVFFISGTPSGVTLPLHLYTFIYPGSCAALGAQPVYEMNQVVLADRVGSLAAGWRMSKRVAVPLEQLRAGDYSIVMRTSPADGYRDIFCGEII